MHCEPTSLITLTGASKNKRRLISNELGSNELHRKHVVRLETEDGVFIRSRIIDQRLIDKLFNDELIDVDQYDAACAFHALAHRSGMYPSSMQLERVQMSVGNRAPRALAILAADKYLQNNTPTRAYRAVWLTVVREINSPIRDLRTGLNSLKQFFNPTITPGSRRAPDSVRSAIERAEKALDEADIDGPIR